MSGARPGTRRALPLRADKTLLGLGDERAEVEPVAVRVGRGETLGPQPELRVFGPDEGESLHALLPHDRAELGVRPGRRSAQRPLHDEGAGVPADAVWPLDEDPAGPDPFAHAEDHVGRAPAQDLGRRDLALADRQTTWLIAKAVPPDVDHLTVGGRERSHVDHGGALGEAPDSGHVVATPLSAEPHEVAMPVARMMRALASALEKRPRAHDARVGAWVGDGHADR